MPKIKFGATKEQLKAATGGSREAPKPGLYQAKVLSIDWEDKVPNKDPRFHVILEITKGDYKGYRLHTYLIPGSDTAVWKYHSFLVAVGLMSDKKLKGEFNTDRPQDLPELMVKVKTETYEGEERGKENGMYPLKDSDASAAADDDDDDDEDEAEAEPEAEDDDEDEEIDLDELDRAELKALIKEQGLEIRVLKSMDDDAVRAAIAEALGGEGEAEDDEDDEDEEKEDGGDAEDYNTWELTDLKEELKSRGLKATGPKPQLVKRLQESDEADPFAE